MLRAILSMPGGVWEWKDAKESRTRTFEVECNDLLKVGAFRADYTKDFFPSRSVISSLAHATIQLLDGWGSELSILTDIALAASMMWSEYADVVQSQGLLFST